MKRVSNGGQRERYFASVRHVSVSERQRSRLCGQTFAKESSYSQNIFSHDASRLFHEMALRSYLHRYLQPRDGLRRIGEQHATPFSVSVRHEIVSFFTVRVYPL